MTQPSHRLCPVCGEAFAAGEAVLQCSGCNTVYHPACWIEIDGCDACSSTETQPIPLTFRGAPPPSSGGDAPAPAPSRPAPAASTAPLPVRYPRNIGSLGRGQRRSPDLLQYWYVPVGLVLAAAIALGIVWGIDALRGDGDSPAEPVPAPTATATPTPAPATPAPTATPAPSTPDPTPPPTPERPVGRFSIGETVVVAGTDSCLNIRAGASIGAIIIECLADGTSATVVDGPVVEGNLTWWYLSANGVEGWGADLYLVRP